MGFVLFDAIGDAFSAAGDFLGDVAEGAMDLLATGAEYVGKAVSKTAEVVGDLTSSAFRTGGKILNGFATGVGNFLGGAIKTVGNVASGIGNFTMDALGGAFNILGKATNGILNFAGDVGNAFIGTVGKAYNATKSFISGAVNFVGNAFGGLVNFGADVLGKVIDFGGDLFNGAKDFLGGIFNFGKDLIEDGLDWLGGRTEAEHELYANYEQVAIVCDELNNIAKKGMGDAQDAIFEAIDRLNNVKGFKEYVGYIDKAKYEQILSPISDLIAAIATSIQEKAEAIKKYEESSLLEKAGSTLTMVAAKTVEGGLSILESIGDGGVYLAGWIGGNVFGNKDFQQDCENFIEKNLSHDVLGFYYNSDFAKASVFKEDSLASGAFKLVGKGLGMMAVGPGGVIASGFGKGVEGALQNGVSYNDAFGHGLVTAAAQGIAGNVLLGAGVAGQALASTVGDVVAGMAQPSADDAIELVEEDNTGDETGDTGGNTNVNTTIIDEPTSEVQYRNTETVSSGGGGGSYIPRKETTTVDPIISTTDPTTSPTTEPTTEPTTPTTEPTTPPTTAVPTTATPTTAVPTTVPNTEPSGYTVYVTPTNPPYYRVETTTPGMEYNGGDGPVEEVLDNSDTLADLDTMVFDNDLDEIVKNNKYTKIPVSTSPIQSTKKNGASGIVPVAAGLSVAAAAGLGAKAYMDYKRNNSDLDESDGNELDEEDEDTSDDYSDSDNIEIEETERDKELKENMNDYYQSDSVYTARDIIEGI